MKVCDPPHEPTTVKVPVAGGLENVIEPLKSYKFVTHEVGEAVIPEMEQGVVQLGGAVYCSKVLQLGKLEKDAVIVQFPPFAGNPVKEYGTFVKGALNVCVPPQLLVSVRVPEFGTEIPGPAVTVRFPFTE